MGSRGPAKTPTKILKLRGSWHGDVRNDEEPEATGKLRKPQWLKDDAGKLWKQVAAELTSLNLTGTIDSHMLARYCALFTRWLVCEDFIREHGMTQTVETKDGSYDKEYPQVARSESLHEKLVKVERNFGMSPSARVNLVPQFNSKKEANASKDRYFKSG